MLVTTLPGQICPKEGKYRDYIIDTDPSDVPDTEYYRRLLADGSLVEVTPSSSSPALSQKAAEPISKEAKANDDK